MGEFTDLRLHQYMGNHPMAGSPSRRANNWTSAKLEIKLGQIEKILSSMPEKPAVLGVSEVRDSSVTAKLARHLNFSETIETRSATERGMDVALLVNPSENMQIVSTREVPLVGPEFEWNKTRNLLVATVLVADRFLLHLVVVHWPSQGGPTTSRVEAARQTRNLVDKLISDFPGSEAIVLGDFNTLEDEADHVGRHPFKTIFRSGDGPSQLTDLFSIPEAQAEIPQPEGTYYFAPKDQWNRLDRFFVTPGLLGQKETGLRIRPKSFAIHTNDQITQEYTRPSGEKIRIPAAYNFETENPEKAGYSDHSGIYVTLEAHWKEPMGPEIAFQLDRDILTLSSVVLFPKETGSRRFIPWKEYQENKDLIGKSGPYEKFTVKNPESFAQLTDDPEGGNFLFKNTKYDMDKADPTNMQGPKWKEMIEALADPDSARKVIIEIPSYRTQSPESVYQVFQHLMDLGIIKNLPLLENIRPVK